MLSLIPDQSVGLVDLMDVIIDRDALEGIQLLPIQW